MKPIVGILVLLMFSASCGPLGNSSDNYSADRAETAFRDAGIPLVETSLDDPDYEIVNPSGGILPNSLLHPAGRGGFAVYIYGSPGDAEALVEDAPRVDPIFNQRRSLLRRKNIVVIVQPANDALEHRLNQILSDL